MTIEPVSGSEALAAIAPGAWLLRGAALPAASGLMRGVGQVTAAAPFRHMMTPGGKAMSVAMTSCGPFGWVTDRRGYRYADRDPARDVAWPPMPASFVRLAHEAAAAAGYDNFVPDSCLINRYVPNARMALHQDKDERDMDAPIVSVSLGLPAQFMFGGLRRSDPIQRLILQHGDVLVWGGPSRLCFHGIARVQPPDLLSNADARFNLTLRKSQ